MLEQAIQQTRLRIEKYSEERPDKNLICQMVDNKLTAQEIIDNMKMLYFAGTETTGSLMTTALGHLAANEPEQRHLLEELQQAGVENIEDLTDEKLRNLNRLHAVMYEALRLVPPIPAQVRKVNTEFGNYAYFIDHFHRLRDSNLVGHDPEKFRPERILENPNLKKEIDKTFGSGRSPCLGKYFAISETLLLIVAVILQGPFECIEGDPSVIVREAGAHLSPNLKIQFKQD